MDGQYSYNRNAGYRKPKPAPGESLAKGALILSVVALMCVCCIYPGMICGALAVILALLSRGQAKRPVASGRLAIVIGTSAMVLSVVLIVAEFAYIMANYGSIDAFMQSYMATMDELTGGSYSQMYEMYGY